MPALCRIVRLTQPVKTRVGDSSEEICSSSDELATCVSNCSYSPPSYDACATEVDAMNACIIALEGPCTDGKPKDLQSCQDVANAFADCVRAR